jgi:glucose repression regulatory protein TUP1
MYELENKHAKIRQQYEDELARLRAELTQAARQGPPGPPTGPGLGPGAGIPPSYGPGGDGFYSRSSREEPRRVGREDRERERERERAPIDRERGMDRERERPAERERDIDRKLKSDRMKSDRGGSYCGLGRAATCLAAFSDPYSPSLSAGPSNGRAPPPPTGPGLPPPATPTNGDYPMSDGTNPGTMTAYRSSMGCEDFTEDFDPYQAGPDRKKEGPDWWAVFSAKAKRTLDVSLVHTLQHDT